MALPPSKSLTAADGAEFLGLIQEVDNGQWRASANVRLDSGSHVDDQPSGIEMFGSEADARAWIDRAAQARGFTSVIPNVERLK